MTTLEQRLKNNRPNIKNSSISTYTSSLRNLYKRMTEDFTTDPHPDWFDHHSNDILEFMKDLPASKRKLKLAALVVLTNNDEAKNKYHKCMMQDIKDYKEIIEKQGMTERQKDNWLSLDTVKNFHDNMKSVITPILKKNTLSDLERDAVQDYIILSLYVLNPPRRIIDYTDMKLHDSGGHNYNYIKNKKFYFNVYKSAKTYGEQIIPIDPELYTLLQKWRKLNPNRTWLLEKNNGNKFVPSYLTLRLNKIFGGKKISVNQLRHIFITDKVLKDMPKLSDLQKTANAMAHSVDTQILYKKFDEK